MKFADRIKTKKIKYGSYSAIMMIGLIIALLLINYFVTSLDNKQDLSVDMTAYRLYSLTSATKDVIETVDEDIFIYTTETAGIEDANIEELLNNYASSSDKLHVVNIDIVKNPAAIEYYNESSGTNVSAGSIIVSNSPNTNDSSQRYRILEYAELYVYNQESQSYDRFNAEDAITGAIKYVVRPNNQKIWLMDNHSTDNAFNAGIKEVLEGENYQVELLNILNGQSPIEKGDIVIILALDNDLTLVERDILNEFLDDGGRIIIGISPTVNAVTDLSNALSIMERYNIKMGLGIIIETDLDNVAVTSDNDYTYSFIIPQIKEHEITNEFLLGDYKLLLGMSAGRLILPDKVNDKDISIDTLLTASSTSFIEPWSTEMDMQPDNNAEFGEFPVMAAITDDRGNNEASSKIIVLSAPELFTYAQSFSQKVYKNKDFLLKCVSWLGDDDEDFYISSKPLISSPLMIETMNQAYFIIALVCVIIPLLIFIMGIVIFIKRKNL